MRSRDFYKTFGIKEANNTLLVINLQPKQDYNMHLKMWLKRLVMYKWISQMEHHQL